MPRVRSLRQGCRPLPSPLAGRLLLICQNRSNDFSYRKPLLTSAHPKLGWEVLLKSPRDSDRWDCTSSHIPPPQVSLSPPCSLRSPQARAWLRVGAQ